MIIWLYHFIVTDNCSTNKLFHIWPIERFEEYEIDDEDGIEDQRERIENRRLVRRSTMSLKNYRRYLISSNGLRRTEAELKTCDELQQLQDAEENIEEVVKDIDRSINES